MDQTLKLLNQVMMDSAMRVGYPQKIINGGYTDKQIKAVQENFVDKFVPQNSTEKAMRRAQANMQGFDYANIDWKNLNYADFKKLVSSEQTKLASNMANTPENQSKVAQTYKAMLDHSVNRSFFSKLFNLVRYVGERNAISRYKRQAMAKFAIDERAFDALCQVVPNAEVQTLKEGIETNYRNMVAEHRKDNSISELSSVKIGGMSERDSIGDLEFDNISRKDNLDRSISSSDDGDFELDNTLGANGKLDKDNLSVLSSNDQNRIKFTVEEANHEHADKDLKKKEEAKEERKEEIKNEKKGYEKQP